MGCSPSISYFVGVLACAICVPAVRARRRRSGRFRMHRRASMSGVQGSRRDGWNALRVLDPVTGNKCPAMTRRPATGQERKYPVLYLLHGIGGNETQWQSGQPT